MTPTEDRNEKRMLRIRKLLGCKKDTELAKKLKTNQPQISRWRNTGFHESTTILLDHLLLIISRQKRELNRLKKELAELKQSVAIKD